MSSCCMCDGGAGAAAAPGSSMPLICLVPRDKARGADMGSRGQGSRPASSNLSSQSFQLLDEKYIKKHFQLPQRALYLDPFRRPLITFPMTQEAQSNNFNLARKYKINQQILDGFLDPSEAISAPSVFPYGKTAAEKRKETEEDEEIIYILQLPDWEFNCPVHNQTIRTPRFIWHSCKKNEAKTSKDMKQGGGPMNKPKPWLLSRHTDFDLLSQCPLERPGFDALGMTAPILVQMNPQGKWESCAPESLDEQQLRAVVQHLVNSKAVSAAQSYCCQCAADNKLNGSSTVNSEYVPIIMMPIYPSDQCPFDMECELAKMKQSEPKQTKKNQKAAETVDSENKEQKKAKKRGFVMQRFTDFDLLSQW